MQTLEDIRLAEWRNPAGQRGPGLAIGEIRVLSRQSVKSYRVVVADLAFGRLARIVARRGIATGISTGRKIGRVERANACLVIRPCQAKK